MVNHTFVVLAYKESPYLDECVQSLIEQTVKSTILIATSTPCTLIERIAAKYSLALSINQGEKGIAADWNFGLAEAKTPFVTLAHQDDLYLPEFTEKMLQVATQRPDNLITFCDYAEQVGSAVTTSTLNLRVKRAIVKSVYWRQSHLKSPLLKRFFFSFGSPIPCPAVMYNGARLAGFQFSSSFSINMDWDAWVRIAARRGSIGYVRETLQIHRLHGESETTVGITDKRRLNEDREMFERLWPRPIAAALRKLYAKSYQGNAG